MDERRISQQRQAQNEARAEIAYAQGLWYAWGRIDSGEYAAENFRLNPFDFAQGVKTNQLAFDEERTHYNESIQGQWDKFVAAERAAQ